MKNLAMTQGSPLVRVCRLGLGWGAAELILTNPESLFLICAAMVMTQGRRLLNTTRYFLKLPSSRRRAIASAVYQPCLRAFLFPFGAPGDFPPCIRHRPFFIAGDWHKLPRLVRALHRDAWCICKCMGLILRFGW